MGFSPRFSNKIFSIFFALALLAWAGCGPSEAERLAQVEEDLMDERDSVCLHAIDQVARMEEPSETLLKVVQGIYLRPSKAFLRTEALKVVVRHDVVGPKVVKHLISDVLDDDEYLQRAAFDAIKSLSKHRAEFLGDLRTYLLHGGPNQRPRAAHLLAAFAPAEPETRKALESALETEWIDVNRKQIHRSLAKLPGRKED